MKRISVAIVSLLVLRLAWADWPTQPGQDLRVSTERIYENRYAPQVVPVARENTLVFQDRYLNVQRLDEKGNPLWGDAGKRVSVTSDQVGLVGTPDGLGGAILAWSEWETGDVRHLYVQRVDVAGDVAWRWELYDLGDQSDPQLASDGQGGAIVAWQHQDWQYDQEEVRAQRIDPSGNPQWGTDLKGVRVSPAGAIADQPSLVRTGDGGAFIVWQSGWDESDIHAQRVSGQGALLWNANGIAVCSETGNQTYPLTVPDGKGGFIACWTDRRSGQDQLYAQRVAPDGSLIWTGGGVHVADNHYRMLEGAMTTDAAGGAILSWQTRDIDGNRDLYAQRLDPSGQRRWNADGIPVCTAPQKQGMPALVPAGDGGAIVFWRDERRTSSGELYASRVSFDGNTEWVSGGVLVSGLERYGEAFAVAGDGRGGAVAAFSSVAGPDPYGFAKRIASNGLLGESGALPYGIPTAGCFGDPSIRAGNDPWAGSVFQVLAADLPPDSDRIYLLVGVAPDRAGTLYKGVRVHVDLGRKYLVIPTQTISNPAGGVRFEVDIPLSLKGKRLYFQIISDKTAACPLRSATDAIEVLFK